MNRHRGPHQLHSGNILFLSNGSWAVLWFDFPSSQTARCIVATLWHPCVCAQWDRKEMLPPELLLLHPQGFWGCSCGTLRIPRANLYVKICMGAHWSKLTAPHLLLQEWLLKCRATSALPRLLLPWVKRQDSLHFHHVTQRVCGFQILKQTQWLLGIYICIN